MYNCTLYICNIVLRLKVSEIEIIHDLTDVKAITLIREPEIMKILGDHLDFE